MANMVNGQRIIGNLHIPEATPKTEPLPLRQFSSHYARGDENFVLASYGRERADTIN